MSQNNSNYSIYVYPTSNFIFPDYEKYQKEYASDSLAYAAGADGMKGTDILGISIQSNKNLTMSEYYLSVLINYLSFLISSYKDKNITDKLSEIIALLGDTEQSYEEDRFEGIRSIMNNLSSNCDYTKKNINYIFDMYVNESGELGKVEEEYCLKFNDVLDHKTHAQFSTYFNILIYLMNFNDLESRIDTDSISSNIKLIKDIFFNSEGKFEINYLSYIYDKVTSIYDDIEQEKIGKILGMLKNIQSLYDKSNKTTEDQLNAMMSVFNVLYGFGINVFIVNG